MEEYNDSNAFKLKYMKWADFKAIVLNLNTQNGMNSWMDCIIRGIDYTIDFCNGDPINDAYVLKWSHSDCGKHVMLPTAPKSSCTWAHLMNNTNKDSDEVWIAQQYIPSLVLLGEWQVIIVGGQTMSITHTHWLNNGSWSGILVTSFLSLEEAGKIWIMAPDSMSPKLQLGYFVNKVEQTPTMSFWLFWNINNTRGIMADTLIVHYQLLHVKCLTRMTWHQLNSLVPLTPDYMASYWEEIMQGVEVEREALKRVTKDPITDMIKMAMPAKVKAICCGLMGKVYGDPMLNKFPIPTKLLAYSLGEQLRSVEPAIKEMVEWFEPLTVFGLEQRPPMWKDHLRALEHFASTKLGADHIHRFLGRNNYLPLALKSSKCDEGKSLSEKTLPGAIDTYIKESHSHLLKDGMKSSEAPGQL
ncbi:hypothetical protein BKA82DRAFT_4020175 [Pisolithus tinctorius]|nr:hypothetical protein BKA82DRAFT_4020175 [Pisolithus tinctorius]